MNKIIRLSSNKEEDILDEKKAVDEYMSQLLEEASLAGAQGDHMLRTEKLNEYFNLLRRSIGLPDEYYGAI